MFPLKFNEDVFLQEVTLTWNSRFDIEPQYHHNECRYDYVEIKQRYTESNQDELVGRYCGMTAPDVQVLQGPVYIRFFTDRVVAGEGWRLDWITGKLCDM